MSVNSKNRLPKRLRWSARVICIILTVCGGTIIVAEAIGELLSKEPSGISLAGIMLVLIILIGFAGLLLSWWKDLISGILLVSTSVAFGIHIGICAGRNHFLVWLIVGFPYLVAGSLMLYTWYLVKRNI
jgi:hypothetical protein